MSGDATYAMETGSTESPLAQECARRVGEVLPRLVRFVRQYIEAVPMPDGLTTAQYFVLALVAEGVSSPGELAQRFAVSSPTITGLVTRLEDKGLLTRTPGTQDRRTIHLTINERGAETLTRVETHILQRVSGMVNTLTEAQQGQIIATLDNLNALLLWEDSVSLDGPQL